MEEGERERKGGGGEGMEGGGKGEGGMEIARWKVTAAWVVGATHIATG